MRHDETRDNITDIETNLAAADAHNDTRDMIPVDMDNPREGFWQLTDADIIRE